MVPNRGEVVLMIIDLEIALLNHFRSEINEHIVLRNSNDEPIALPKNRVVFSLSDDEHAHRTGS